MISHIGTKPIYLLEYIKDTQSQHTDVRFNKKIIIVQTQLQISPMCHNDEHGKLYQLPLLITTPVTESVVKLISLR